MNAQSLTTATTFDPRAPSVAERTEGCALLPGSTRTSFLRRLFVLLPVVALSASAQGPAAGKVPAITARGFTAPITDATGRRTGLVTGDSAQPDLMAGRLRVTGFQFESYSDAPEPAVDLIIRAADAVFQLNPPAASGAGLIELLRPDGRFTVRGEGWSWEQARDVLRITNRVETTLVLATNRPDSAPVRLSAGRFEYGLRSGALRYDDAVQAVQPGFLELAASALVTRVSRAGEPPQALDAAGPVTLILGGVTNLTRLTGDGGRFLAMPAGPELTLTGAVTWATPLFAGRAARLDARPDAGEFHAAGGVELAVDPRVLARGSSAPATNSPPLLVRAAEVRAAPGRVSFLGGVEAARAGELAMTAREAELQLTPKNTFAGLAATGDVTADFLDSGFTNRLTGGRLLVTPAGAGERIEVEESPRWTTRGLAGTAQRLVLEPALRRVLAEGPAEVEVTLARATNRAPERVTVQAARIEALGTNVALAGPVTARHPKWDMTAGAATLALGEGLALRGLAAREGVVFESAPVASGTNSAPASRLLTSLIGAVTRTRLEAREFDAELDAAGEPLAAEARGGVRLRAGGLTGTAERLVRDPATGELRLLDSPTLRSVQGFSLAGRPETVIIVDPATGRGRVEGPLAEPMRVP
ncbi:MAG: hypothetical protein ACKVYV_01920, partial [Limisphaerales bacterium]